MKIHREGYRVILIVIAVLAVIYTILFFVFFNNLIIQKTFLIYATMFLIFVLHFFIRPDREVVVSEGTIYSPADGEVVVIEKTLDTEYFNEERLQVSIFMSIWDFHVNWVPIPGKIVYKKYHKGKYLIARNPKSSLENERITSVIRTTVNGQDILIRQITGAVARKISNYKEVDDQVAQNEELGFIKFGSRVDILLPLNTELNISLRDKVKGNQTILGYLKID